MDSVCSICQAGDGCGVTEADITDHGVRSVHQHLSPLTGQTVASVSRCNNWCNIELHHHLSIQDSQKTKDFTWKSNILINKFSFFRCRASQDCPSFLLDYDKSACFRLDINTEDSRDIIVPTDTRCAVMIISRDVSPRHVTCHIVTRQLVARCSWHSLTLWSRLDFWLLALTILGSDWMMAHDNYLIGQVSLLWEDLPAVAGLWEGLDIRESRGLPSPGNDDGVHDDNVNVSSSRVTMTGSSRAWSGGSTARSSAW